MFVQLLDAAGKNLGLVQMVDTPSYSRSPAGEAVVLFIVESFLFSA
jgi:hypothetical protein